MELGADLDFHTGLKRLLWYGRRPCSPIGDLPMRVPFVPLPDLLWELGLCTHIYVSGLLMGGHLDDMCARSRHTL